MVLLLTVLLHEAACYSLNTQAAVLDMASNRCCEVGRQQQSTAVIIQAWLNVSQVHRVWLAAEDSLEHPQRGVKTAVVVFQISANGHV